MLATCETFMQCENAQTLIGSNRAGRGYLARSLSHFPVPFSCHRCQGKHNVELDWTLIDRTTRNAQCAGHTSIQGYNLGIGRAGRCASHVGWRCSCAGAERNTALVCQQRSRQPSRLRISQTLCGSYPHSRCYNLHAEVCAGPRARCGN